MIFLTKSTAGRGGRMFLKQLLLASAFLPTLLGAAELQSPEAPFVETAADLYTPSPMFSADKYVCGNKQIMWNNAYDHIILQP